MVTITPTTPTTILNIMIKIMKLDRDKRYDLLSSLIGWGYLDIERTIEVLEEAEIDFFDFSNYVDNFCSECGVPLRELDICGLAYEYVLQKARSQINEILGKDIFIDTDEFFTYGNYMCSGYCFSDEALKQISQWIKKIEKSFPERMTPQISFLETQLY